MNVIEGLRRMMTAGVKLVRIQTWMIMYLVREGNPLSRQRSLYLQ